MSKENFADHIYVVGNIVFLFRFCFCEGGHLKENYHPMKILLGHIRMEHKVDKNFNLLRQEFGQIWALPGPLL